jgi:hypothetical protein
MTLAPLLQVYHLKEREECAKEEIIKLPISITKLKDIQTNIKDLDSYLLRNLGETGLPLAYIVREEVGLPVVDLGFDMPDYSQEMIFRGDNATATYQNDHKEVWNVIRHLTRGGSTWSWVSQYAQRSNGRAAYMAT